MLNVCQLNSPLQAAIPHFTVYCIAALILPFEKKTLIGLNYFHRFYKAKEIPKGGGTITYKTTIP